MIDFHCHLDLYPDPVEIANDCERRGLHILSVTNTPSAWHGTRSLATGSSRILTALGLHPQLAHEREGELPLFDRLLPQAKYVGEVGLDGDPEYLRHWSQQVAVFEHILEKCAELGDRCMSIHSRRATTEVLDRIARFQGAGVFILHWFSGGLGELDRAIELGCWFSVGPAMLAGKKGQALATRMPRERVVPESDGPFARVKGKPVLPWETELVATQLSSLWSLSVDNVDRILMDNLEKLL